MDVQAFVGGLSVGKEISGNVMLTIMGSLAVRTPDGKFVSVKEGRIVDVTAFVLEGSDRYLFRLPTSRVQRDDLIIISDETFRAISVIEQNENGNIKGIDLRSGTITEYVPTGDLIQQNMLVKVSSLLNPEEKTPGSESAETMMRLLLLQNSMQSGGHGKADMLDAFVMMKVMGVAAGRWPALSTSGGSAPTAAAGKAAGGR
jgi:hypothetical protein